MSHHHFHPSPVYNFPDSKDDKSNFPHHAGAMHPTGPPPPSFAESQAAPSYTSPYQYPPPPPPPQGQPLPPGSSSPMYPIQPHHTPVTARTLQIKWTDWLGRHLALFDGDAPTALYHAKCKLTKPHMIFQPADGSTTIATVALHTFTSRIDITLGPASTSLTTSGMLKSKYHFPSVAHPGLTLTWESRKAAMHLVCLDPAGIAVARFSWGGCSMRKFGQIEILDPRAASGPRLDEIVVSGLAIAYLILVVSSAVVA